MAIKVNVEITADGTYWGTTQNIPGVISSDGNSLDELKSNLTEALKIYIETAENNQIEIGKMLSKGLEFEFQIQLSDLFKKLKVINQSQFAKRIGINPTLLRQYSTNPNIYVSEKRANEIQKGLHNLGLELMSIKL